MSIIIKYEFVRFYNDSQRKLLSFLVWILFLDWLGMGKFVMPLQQCHISYISSFIFIYACSYVILAADATSSRSILVFQHDLDKVSSLYVYCNSYFLILT